MRRILPGIAVLALVSVSACGSSEPTAAAPTPAPAPTVTASSTPATDYQAQLACELVTEALASAPEGLMKDRIPLQIESAGRATSNAEIHAAAEAVADSYRDAVLAEGTDDEVITLTQLTTTAVELSTACLEAGLGRVK